MREVREGNDRHEISEISFRDTSFTYFASSFNFNISFHFFPTSQQLLPS